MRQARRSGGTGFAAVFLLTMAGFGGTAPAASLSSGETGGFDVRHIRAEVVLEPKDRTFRGTATQVLAPVGRSLRRVELDCGPNLKVERVTAGGAACPFEHEGERLTIELDRPYAPGSQVRLAVAYAGTPRRGITFATADPAYPDRLPAIWTNGEPNKTHNWLPCRDRPDDRATSEVVATIARPWRVVSNGALVAERDNGDGTATYHWRMDEPHASYLISLTAAEFSVFRDYAGRLPIEYYVPRGTVEDEARRALGRTPAMISFFQRRFGVDYPFAKYAQVCVPDYSSNGLENITATTLDASILCGPLGDPERESDGLVAHELAHQWFGGLVGIKDWSQLWLSEAFASYAALLYQEHAAGPDAFRLGMDAYLRRYLRHGYAHRNAIVRRDATRPEQMFELSTYVKGACVLHALRGTIGEAAWWDGLRRYVQSQRGKPTDTADFRRAMEAASGRDLGWFFAQWVDRPGHPKLRVRWGFEPASGLVRVRVEQRQGSPYRLPTTLELIDPQGTRRAPIVVAGPADEFVIPSASAPLTVRLDPDGWLPKEVEYDKPGAEWVAQLARSPGVLGRLEAARALGDRADDPAAARALAGAWSREREAAARAAMVKRLGANALNALRAATADRSARVRAAAVERLARASRAKEDEARLRRIYARRDEPHAVRAAALRGLVALDVADRDDLLRSALSARPDDGTIASTALGLILTSGADGARAVAAEYLRYGRPSPLRRATIAGIGRAAARNPELRRELVALIDDPDPWVRADAWDALARLRVRDALPALETRQRDDAEQYFPDELRASITALRAAAEEPAETAETTAGGGE